MRSRLKDNLWGWLFVLPTITGIIIINIYPTIRTFWQSFHRVGDFGRGNEFVGGENYARLFEGGPLGDGAIWQPTYNTLLYTALVVPASIVIGLVLAVFLNGSLRGKTTFRAIYFLPMVVAPAAVGMVWRWLFNPQFGLINATFGLDIHWISAGGSWIPLIALSIIGIWSVIGYNVILFLAGLQTIPKDYYEASSIDGATGIRQFFNITVPLISPMMFFVTVTSVMATMQMFDHVFMVIGATGNPAMPRTQTLVFYFYRQAFMERFWGRGAVVVVWLMLIIALFTLIQFVIQKKWVHYD